MIYCLISIMKWTIKEFNLWLSEGALINENITSLNISNCNIVSILDINNLPMLQTLSCSHNQITDIQKLRLPVLEALYCNNNKITNIVGLQLHMLQELDCVNNNITNIQGLCLPMLQELYCSHNQITNIQELQLPMLQTLNCTNNNIIDIQGLQLPTLERLYCYTNKITDIQELQLPMLRTLYCDNNQITNIQRLQLPMLKVLCCSNNNITTLSLYHTQHLTYIEYHANPIEYIAPNLRNIVNRTRQNIYTDTQNVHNHHIQECIRMSIHNIISIVPTLDPLLLKDYIVKDDIFTETCKQLLLEYIDDKCLHSTLNITFEDLLLSTLSIINDHINKDEIKRILNDEINDSLCKCYTGRMSRLINCLNGYSDKVNIQISDTEQIGHIIHSVKIELLDKDDYTVTKHKELVKLELLDRQYDVAIVELWISYIE